LFARPLHSLGLKLLKFSSSTILNNHLASFLSGIISPSEARAIADNLSAIQTLTTEKQASVRRAFAEGYQAQNWFLTVMTGLGFCCCLLIWERAARRVA
jgi:hypothetical protein